MNGLRHRKRLVGLKNRARRLEIHTPDTDRALLDSLRTHNRFFAPYAHKKPDNFWFEIPSLDDRPLWANIRRTGASQFELYILYDQLRAVPRHRRRFGRGGMKSAHPNAVTEALDDLFAVAFGEYRRRPTIMEEDELPLFAEANRRIAVGVSP